MAVPIEIVEWSGVGEIREHALKNSTKTTRGWRRPITGAYVGRPTQWGNPYKVGRGKHTAEEAVMLFRRDLLAGTLPFTIEDVRRELKGMDLMCWCEPGAPCHADVLLEVANGSQTLTPRRHRARPIV
jgi:hypothetical protein